MERQEDIEIYVSGKETGTLEAWLGEALVDFAVTRREKNQVPAQATGDDGSTLSILLIANVSRSGYSSLWIKENNSPWDTDLACAQAAYDSLQCNIRCTAGGWSEQDEEDLWWQVNASGVQQVSWQLERN